MDVGIKRGNTCHLVDYSCFEMLTPTQVAEDKDKSYVVDKLQSLGTLLGPKKSAQVQPAQYQNLPHAAHETPSALMAQPTFSLEPTLL